MAYHPCMISTAYLRIYLPAEAVGGLPPHRADAAPTRVSKTDAFIWDESTRDDALYTVWQGHQFVCPRNARLRMIEGILAFTKAHPALAMMSDDERMDHARELSKLRRSSTHARSYILSSAWHVPLRWFSAFTRAEREVYEAGGYSSIRYRTSLGEAIDRVHWSIGVLENAGFADQVIERVADLERWLTEFGPDSMVELDYGEVATTFRGADLVFDESADDVRASLLALEQGDGPGSADAYERVARRWADAQSYTYSN
jgi:hypothetical protein